MKNIYILLLIILTFSLFSINALANVGDSCCTNIMGIIFNCNDSNCAPSGEKCVSTPPNGICISCTSYLGSCTPSTTCDPKTCGGQTYYCRYPYGWVQVGDSRLSCSSPTDYCKQTQCGGITAYCLSGGIWNTCPNGKCSNGQCCTNECTSITQTRCSGGTKQTCGNYDSDSCLEFPTSTSGSGNEACQYGCSSDQSGAKCNPAPPPPACTPGASCTGCSGGLCSTGQCVYTPGCDCVNKCWGNLQLNRDKIANTCEWDVCSDGTPYCDTSQINTLCNSNTCPPGCPAGEKRCKLDSTNVAQTCWDYNGDGCYEWGGDFPCSSGQICDQGTCKTAQAGCSVTGPGPYTSSGLPIRKLGDPANVDVFLSGKPSTTYTMANVYGIAAIDVISPDRLIVATSEVRTLSNGIYSKNDQTTIPDAYYRSGPYTSYFVEGIFNENNIPLNQASATCGFFYICGSAGNACTENAQCCGTGSTCGSGHCCPENYAWDSTISRCEPILTCLNECNGPYYLCKPNGDYETCTQGTDGCYDFKLVKPTVY